MPQEIRQRPPPPDTWSLPQTQEEFYFSLPYQRMDLCLYALNAGITADVAAPAAGLTLDQIHRVWKDIEAKRRATRYLYEPPLLVDETVRV